MDSIMTNHFFYFLVVILLGLVAPTLAEYCTEHYVGPNGHTSRTIHCSFGCCGDYYDQYCCVSSTGFIVGLVFAGIFTISVIVAVVCCCVKHKGQRGRVIQPTTLAVPQHGTQNVFIVPSNGVQPPAYAPGGNNMMYPGPPAYYPNAPQGGYSYSAAVPPPYASPSALPPAYTQEGPKYSPEQTPNPFANAAGSGSQQ